MRKLAPVEEAKALMREAVGWSLWSWLTKKRLLRTTADQAWEALEELEKEVKAAWPEDLRLAYHEAALAEAADGNAKSRKQYEKARDAARDLSTEVKEAAGKLKKAEIEAHALRMQAEETFDEADRRMSTSMACEGAQQAIDAWERTEKVIRKAESLGRPKPGN